MSNDDCPWVALSLSDQLFAIPSTFVMEMLVVPTLSKVPEAPKYVRGVMNLRDKVITVVDLRLRLGIESAVDEVNDLIELMNERERDHVNWLKELEASVKEDRQFKLATDPHQCKFGIWYDKYQPDNNLVENYLKKFDEPHRRIHGLALKAKDLVKNDKKEKALEIIEREHSRTLAEMVRLFEGIRNLLLETFREIAVVLEHDGKLLAITVDAVNSVAYLKEKSAEKLKGMEAFGDGSLVTKTGKLAQNEKIVMLLDVPMIFSDSDKADTVGC